MNKNNLINPHTGKKLFYKGGTKDGKKLIDWDPYNLSEDSIIKIKQTERKVKGFKEEVITITDKIGKKTIVGHLKRISKSNCGKCTGILRMYIRYGELTKTVPKLKVFLEQRIAGQKEWAIFK